MWAARTCTPSAFQSLQSFCRCTSLLPPPSVMDNLSHSYPLSNSNLLEEGANLINISNEEAYLDQ